VTDILLCCLQNRAYWVNNTTSVTTWIDPESIDGARCTVQAPHDPRYMAVHICPIPVRGRAPRIGHT
jgi:hypothetical protein